MKITVKSYKKAMKVNKIYRPPITRCSLSSFRVASPQTSFARGSLVTHLFLPHVGEERMRDERTPKDLCGEASFRAFAKIALAFRSVSFLLYN